MIHLIRHPWCAPWMWVRVRVLSGGNGFMPRLTNRIFAARGEVDTNG